MHSNDHHKKAELALKHAIDMGPIRPVSDFLMEKGFQ